MKRALLSGSCILMLAACSPSVGNRRCASNADCPASTVCHSNGICFGTVEVQSDAGAWTDARFDAAALDAENADVDTTDAESTDADITDTAATDVDTTDAKSTDADITDTAAADADSRDARGRDQGQADSGQQDATPEDAESQDTAPVDAGSPQDSGANRDAVRADSAQSIDASLSTDAATTDGAANHAPNAPSVTTWHIFPDEVIHIDWSAQDPDGDAVTCSLPASIAPLQSNGWEDCIFSLSYVLDTNNPPAGDPSYSVDVTLTDNAGASTSFTLHVTLLDERGPYVDNAHQPGATTWDAISDLGRCGARARPCADLQVGRSQLLSLRGDGVITDTALKVAYTSTGYWLSDALLLDEIGMTCGYDSSNWDQFELSYGRPRITYHTQYGVEFGASAVIENCWIEGSVLNSAYAAATRAAIHIPFGSPTLSHSRLIGETIDNQSSSAIGLYSESSSHPNLSNNSIRGASSQVSNLKRAIGLWLQGSATLSNNTITGGTAGEVFGLVAQLSDASSLSQATIVVNGGSIEAGQGIDPSSGAGRAVGVTVSGAFTLSLNNIDIAGSGPNISSTESMGLFVDGGAQVSAGGADCNIDAGKGVDLSYGVLLGGSSILDLVGCTISSGSATKASIALLAYGGSVSLTDVSAQAGQASGESLGAALVGSAFDITRGAFGGGQSSKVSSGLTARDPQPSSTITGPITITSGRVSGGTAKASSVALWIDGSDINDLNISEVTASSARAPYDSIALGFATGTTCHNCRVEYSQLTAGVAGDLSAGLALTRAQGLQVYATTMQGGRIRGAGYSAGMVVEASCNGCVIMANKIFGGLAETGALGSAGLRLAHGSPLAGTTLVSGNWIRGGQAKTSIGVDASGPGGNSVLYLLNTIQAVGRSSGASTAYGVLLSPGPPFPNPGMSETIAVFAGNIVDVGDQARWRYHFYARCDSATGVGTQPTGGNANLFWPTITPREPIDLSEPTAYIMKDLTTSIGCSSVTYVRNPPGVASQPGYGNGNYFANPHYQRISDVHITQAYDASNALSFLPYGSIIEDIDLSVRPQGQHMDVGCDEIP